MAFLHKLRAISETKCAPWTGELPSEDRITKSLLPGSPTDARHQLQLQTALLSGAGYHQSPHGSSSPKLASGRLLLLLIGEKQIDLDENTVAECGSINALLTSCLFPIFLCFECLMLMIWLYFQIAGLGFFLSPLSLVSAFWGFAFPSDPAVILPWGMRWVFSLRYKS